MQAGGGVDDVAHRRVVGTGQRADEHLARVDPDAHLDRRVGTDVVDEASERRLHAQRRPHGPFGVVLVGDRRTEQGDDGVAEQLVDAPAELLDVGDEPLETGLDEPLDTLRIEMLGERRVADEVGEQHRDDTALFEGERGRLHRVAARGAEPCPRRHRVGADRARNHRHAQNLRPRCP